MAEDIRSIEEIVNELFKAGSNSAIGKCTNVSHVNFLMGECWCGRGVPLSSIDKKVKAYFTKKFLNGCRIDQADEKTLREGFERLDYAMNNGCRGRCRRLIKELNQAFSEVGLSPVEDIDALLDWLTFSPRFLVDHNGIPLVEKPEGTLMPPVFDDDRNRQEFWAEMQHLLKAGKMCSLHDIAILVAWKRRNAISLK